MIEKILSDYKKEISSYSLVFKHTRKYYYSFHASFFLLGISPFIFVIANLYKWKLPFKLILSIIILFFIITFSLLNKVAKEFIQRNYNIISTEFIWRNYEFDYMQAEKMQKYLNKNKLLSESKIKLIIEYLNKEAERKKFPKLFVPGIFIILFTPVWVKFVDIYYSQLNEPQIALAVLIALSITFYILISLLNYIKYMYFDFIEFFFNNEYQNIISLVSILEDQLLRLDNCEMNNYTDFS